MLPQAINKISEMESLGIELVSLGDAGVTDGSFTAV